MFCNQNSRSLWHHNSYFGLQLNPLNRRVTAVSLLRLFESVQLHAEQLHSRLTVVTWSKNITHNKALKQHELCNKRSTVKHCCNPYPVRFMAFPRCFLSFLFLLSAVFSSLSQHLDHILPPCAFIFTLHFIANFPHNRFLYLASCIVQTMAYYDVCLTRTRLWAGLSIRDKTILHVLWRHMPAFCSAHLCCHVTDRQHATTWYTIPTPDLLHRPVTCALPCPIPHPVSRFQIPFV